MMILWLSTLSGPQFTRVTVSIGLCAAYVVVFQRVKLCCSNWSQLYGEQILQVSENDEAPQY